MPRSLAVLILAIICLSSQIPCASSEPWKAGTGQTATVVDQWYRSNANFADVSFPDADTGFAVTRDGDVFVSEDGGLHWALKLSTQRELRGITFVDRRQGWVAGQDGLILHTVDGGANWRQQTSPLKVMLTAIHFSDGAAGWVVGNNRAILRTNDGGERWVAGHVPASVGTVNLRAIAFLDREAGWVAGEEGTVLQTTDGGATWNAAKLPEPVDLFDISFATPLSGVAVGTKGRAFYTVDGGRNWKGETLNGEATLLSVDLVGEQGWATGQAGYVARIRLHPDGRFEWTPVAGFTRASLRRVTARGDKWWAVGSQGVIASSEKDGPWVLRRGAESSTGLLSAITWRSEREGWIASTDGELLKTSDGGTIWSGVTLPWPASVPSRNRKLNAITFSGASGWAVGNGSAIFATTDGGANWVWQTGPTNRDLLSVWALSAHGAWAVGQAGTILQTTDGSQWTKVAAPERVTLMSVFFLDQDHGWIVGHSGVILETTDGNAWRLRHKEEGVRLRGVDFVDATHGWAVGSDSAILTTADGKEWHRIRGIPGQISFNAVHFVSTSAGWASSDRDGLLATTDGGATWQAHRLLDAQKITELSFLNPSFGWAVGKGLIGRMTSRTLPRLLEFDAVNLATGVELVGKVAQSGLEPRLTGIDYSTDAGANFHPLKLPAPLPVSDGEFRFRWNPSGQDFRDGTTFRYRLKISDGVYEDSKVVDAAFVYKSWFGKLREENPWLIPMLIVMLVFFATMLIPAVLFRFYAWLPWKAASELFGASLPGQVARALACLIFIPFIFRFGWVVRAWARRYAVRRLELSDLAPDILADYIRRPEVLDAWVRRHVDSARTRHRRIAAQIGGSDGGSDTAPPADSGRYIAMPLSLDGTIIEIPGPGTFSWLSESGPVVVTICGPGGCGKSMLAMQLGFWGLDAGPAMVPVVIRYKTSDMLDAVTQALKHLTDSEEDDPDEALVRSLLRFKRLLLIVDSVSEWPDDEQRYIAGIQGQLRIGAMVVTSRRALSYEHQRKVVIGVLDAPSMFRFCQEYVRGMKIALARDFEKALHHGLVEMQDTWFEGKETTCLLVKMYIEDAIVQSLQAGDRFAANAPDIVLRYVQRVTNAGDEDFIVTVTKAAARASLSPEFLVRPVARSDLMSTLGDKLKNVPIAESLKRLVDSRIMESAQVAGTVHLAFTYDPVAEFLASISICEEYRHLEREQWEALDADLSRVGMQASGFRVALQTSLDSYRTSLLLPPHMRLTPASASVLVQA